MYEEIHELRERAFNREEFSESVSGQVDGHDIRYKLAHLGTSGLLFKNPWYYEGIWVDGDLQFGRSTDFPSDHPPRREDTGHVVQTAITESTGSTSWFIPNPPKTAEDEATPGLL